MKTDHILQVLSLNGVEYLLIGGVNFLLKHQPIATFDIDFWIEDSDANLDRCQKALVDLEASWGRTDEEWRNVSELPPGWLKWQAVFCLLSPYGSIDLFRSVKGLGSWTESRQRARVEETPTGASYVGLCDEDMLQCQIVLPEEQRKLDRIRVLTAAVQSKKL